MNLRVHCIVLSRSSFIDKPPCSVISIVGNKEPVEHNKNLELMSAVHFYRCRHRLISFKEFLIECSS